MDPNMIAIDEPQNENGISDKMNISMAFQKLVNINPPRYTKLCETVYKSFEEMTESISQEELKTILGDISFLKSKRNVANLFSTLKTQLNYHMSETFKQIIEEENLSELFAQKTELNEEDAKKYLIDEDYFELIELEETLHKLDEQIAGLEESNELLMNQEKFNNQRYENMLKRITSMIDESRVQYQEHIRHAMMIQDKISKL